MESEEIYYQIMLSEEIYYQQPLVPAISLISVPSFLQTAPNTINR